MKTDTTCVRRDRKLGMNLMSPPRNEIGGFASPPTGAERTTTAGAWDDVLRTPRRQKRHLSGLRRRALNAPQRQGLWRTYVGPRVARSAIRMTSAYGRHRAESEGATAVAVVIGTDNWPGSGMGANCERTGTSPRTRAAQVAVPTLAPRYL